MKKASSHLLAAALAAAGLFLAGLAPARAASETARSADSFVDSIGVDTHFGYQDDLSAPYSNYNDCKGWITSLGVRHVRDGGDIQAGSSKLGMQDTYHNLWTQAGIRTTFVVTPNWGGVTGDVINMINRVTPPALDAVEGCNEPDLFTYGPYNGVTDSNTVVKNWQNDFYSAIKNNTNAQVRAVPVIAPAMADGGNAYHEQWFAPLNSFDFQATHNYQAGNVPSANNPTYIAESNSIGASSLKPIIATESGYSVGSGYDWPVSETTQGKYTSRMLAQDYLDNLPRTFIYQLVQSGQTFGLLTTNTSGGVNSGTYYRPAFYAVQNLIATLKEASWNGASWTVPSFTPGSLNYTISGPSTLKHLLLQKSGGDFYIVLWNEIPVCTGNNASNAGSDITGGQNVNVTLGFTTPVSSSANTWVQNSNGSYTSAPATVTNNSLTVSVPDSLVIVKVSPTTGALIANGTYTLTPQCATGSCLDADISSGGTSNGTKVQVWSKLGGTNQQWVFTNLGGNQYKISPSYATGMCLDVSGALNADGTKVQLWTYDGNYAQRWTAAAVSGGYTFTAGCAPSSRLDVSGAGSANGTQVQIWTAAGNTAQTWALTPIATGVNVLQNAGFESGLNNWTTWTGNGGTGAGAAFTEHYVTPYEGANYLAHYKTTAYEASTYQAVTGLPDGTYTLSAWVESSGGQIATNMSAQLYVGGPNITNSTVTIPTTGAWTQISSTFSVTGGTCVVAFYSNAAANTWIRVDKVSLVKL